MTVVLGNKAAFLFGLLGHPMPCRELYAMTEQALGVLDELGDVGMPWVAVDAREAMESLIAADVIGICMQLGRLREFGLVDRVQLTPGRSECLWHRKETPA